MNYVFGPVFSIFPIIGAILSLGVGILVFVRNPYRPANIGFCLGMLSLTLVEGGYTLFLLSDSAEWYIIGKRISLAGEALLSPTWFLFSLTFARSDYKDLLYRWKLVVIVLFSFAAFFILWINSPLLIRLPDSAITNVAFTLGPVGKYFYIFLLIGILFSLIQLENTLRVATGFKLRQSKYVIIGVGAILIFHIYLASQAILFSTLDLSYIPVTSFVILVSCGMILYTVVRNKLLDVNIFVSRYVIYNSLTILLVGAYLLVVGIVAQGVKMTGGAFDTFWSRLFTVIALLVLGGGLLSTQLRRKLQLFVTRHFYSHKYEFRDKWMETVDKIGINHDMLQLQDSIVEMISETMAVRDVFLWLYEPVQHEYHLVKSTVGKTGQIRLKELHPLISSIKKHNIPFFISDTLINQGKGNDAYSLIMATKAVLCTPLVAGNTGLVGFILQGEDISGEPYRKDDLDLLKAIASHAANSIKNIRLTQELLASKESEAFHQVSSFFIHDLKNFVSTLSLLSNNAEEHIGDPLFQKDALQTLRVIVSKMNGMISNLSVISRELKINPVPLNINDLIDGTLLTLNGKVSAMVVKNLAKVPIIPGDGEQLQKVLLNLVLNAIEATSPNDIDKKISIQTYEKSGEIIISVADEGCGMCEEFISTSLFKPFMSSKSHGLGIGLFQCKKIVEAHSGRIEVESETGKGSAFRVILPT